MEEFTNSRGFGKNYEHHKLASLALKERIAQFTGLLRICSLQRSGVLIVCPHPGT